MKLAMNRNSPTRQNPATQYRLHRNMGWPKVMCAKNSMSMKLSPIAITSRLISRRRPWVR